MKHTQERSSFSGIEILKLKNPGMVFSSASITVIGFFKTPLLHFMIFNWPVGLIPNDPPCKALSDQVFN